MQVGGPDDTDFVNMDSMEMYLELKRAADSKSNERYKAALEKYKLGIPDQIAFEFGMLPDLTPNPTQAYQAHLDVFAFVPTSLGDFAFIVIPDRCSCKYPLRIGFLSRGTNIRLHL